MINYVNRKNVVILMCGFFFISGCSEVASTSQSNSSKMTRSSSLDAYKIEVKMSVTDVVNKLNGTIIKGIESDLVFLGKYLLYKNERESCWQIGDGYYIEATEGPLKGKKAFYEKYHWFIHVEALDTTTSNIMVWYNQRWFRDPDKGDLKRVSNGIAEILAGKLDTHPKIVIEEMDEYQNSKERYERLQAERDTEFEEWKKCDYVELTLANGNTIKGVIKYIEDTVRIYAGDGIHIKLRKSDIKKTHVLPKDDSWKKLFEKQIVDLNKIPKRYIIRHRSDGKEDGSLLRPNENTDYKMKIGEPDKDTEYK